MGRYLSFRLCWQFLITIQQTGIWAFTQKPYNNNRTRGGPLTLNPAGYEDYV